MTAESMRAIPTNSSSAYFQICTLNAKANDFKFSTLHLCKSDICKLLHGYCPSKFLFYCALRLQFAGVGCAFPWPVGA